MMSLKKFNAYKQMTKPSILMLVLVTTALGYYFADRGIDNWPRLFWTLLGAAMTCAGSSVLNQYIERDVDVLMNRTKRRPIPAGIISPASALTFGIVLVLGGVALLCLKVNLLTAFLSLLTAFLYVLVYTPSKRLSWLNTTIGAIPGAIPPMGGWAAAHNDLGFGAWILFFIMFAWQHPHFYAIAWLYREDYARAGFKMLPVVEPDGAKTFNHSVMYCLLLVAVSVMPILVGMAGWIYVAGAVALGAAYLYPALCLQQTHATADARKLVLASVIYLPLLLGFIVLDVVF